MPCGISGQLPVQLQVVDLDKEKTENSTVTISVLSQDPKEPKLNVFQTNGSRLGQLSYEGCFDYDVRLYAIYSLCIHTVVTQGS